MNIENLREAKEYFTQKVSEINRNLAFAGIAIIWIFVTVNEGIIQVPNNLRLSILFFLFSLFCDLIQYIFLSTTWTIYFRIIEKKPKKEQEEFEVPCVFSNIGYIFFYLKIISNIIGFIVLLIHLLSITYFITN